MDDCRKWDDSVSWTSSCAWIYEKCEKNRGCKETKDVLVDNCNNGRICVLNRDSSWLKSADGIASFCQDGLAEHEKNHAPGDKCEKDENCHSSSCINGVCTGKDTSAVCDSSIECKVGQTC